METGYPIVLHDSTSDEWLHFKHPEQIVTTTNLDEVLPALRAIETAVDKNGWYAAGFISYEASPAFDNAFIAHPSKDFPLLWFGLYPKPQRTRSLPPQDGSYQLGKWVPSVNRKTYNAAIAQVKDHIARGNTYQVNYTFRLRNKFTGSPWSLFVDMVNAQVPGYSAFLDIGDFIICSASPELFFHLDGSTVTCRPMKGTARRGRTLSEDLAMAGWLRNSIKNRAENVMIVDMIRNDLGRLAETGSIRVPELFTTERYPSLWQMTSKVTAKIDASFSEIMTALFPCSSITGAPKVSTMKIIAALETTPRRVYTGTIGYLAPGRKAQFSVAIRTLLLERQTGLVEYGTGGGIVWDSTSKDEYAEALLKAQVITRPSPPFSLLETLRWTPQEGLYLLAQHLQRLADSAAYFDFPFDREKIETTLLNAARNLSPSPYRLRLLLHRDGSLTLQSIPLSLETSKQPVRVILAPQPVSSNHIFLFHKTTRREVYDHASQSRPGYDDVLLYNERGELTESTIANLVFDLDGGLVTPPVTCGLLAGTFRSYLLVQGTISEKVVTISDLPRCRQIFLINSVRGWQKAEITASPLALSRS